MVACHLQLQGAFGSIDKLKLPVQTSEDIDIKNATYNGWLSEHFISSVIAFSAEGPFSHLSPTICTQIVTLQRCCDCSKDQCSWQLA
jgi:hypothetical protein